MKSFRELQTEATKQTKKGVIAKAARKGTPPYTVVVLDRLNKVVKQETTQVADAVPAFVHELQKRYPKGDYKISVEDKGGSRVYSEEVEMEEGTSASENLKEDLGLGKVHLPSNQQVMAINRKLKADAPEVLKDWRKLSKALDKSAVTGQEIVYIRDEPSAAYRKKTGFGDAHRVVMRKRTNNPLGKEVVYHSGSSETTYNTVLAFKEEYVHEGTSASDRGEPQTPHTQKQYDALSPKNKKLVDARVKAARKQSMSRNPSESPRNYKKRKPKTRRGGVSKYGRGQTGPLPKNEEEDVKEGIVILPKRSSRGGDVKEVGKDKRGGKTQYWWRHKNGLKNVYDSLEKLRYALRNDANFKDAEEITKQLGEAVNEAIWNKRMSDLEKSREFINPSGSKDLVKWLNTNTRLKVDKFQRDRKLKHDKEQDKIKGRSAVNSKVRNAARSIQIKRAQKKARKKDGFSEEIVDEGGMGRMKDPYTIRYVDPKQKDTTNISVVDGEQEAKKFLAKVKKKGMSGTIKKGSEQPGSIQTVKYNQSTDQLNKASRYDTLTGKRR